MTGNPYTNASLGLNDTIEHLAALRDNLETALVVLRMEGKPSHAQREAMKVLGKYLLRLDEMEQTLAGWQDDYDRIDLDLPEEVLEHQGIPGFPAFAFRTVEVES